MNSDSFRAHIDALIFFEGYGLRIHYVSHFLKRKGGFSCKNEFLLKN